MGKVQAMGLVQSPTVPSWPGRLLAVLIYEIVLGPDREYLPPLSAKAGIG